MTTKAKAESEPALPERVAVRTNLAICWTESERSVPHEFGEGQAAQLPRAVAAQWQLLAWAEPVDPGALTLDELVDALPSALGELEAQRANRGTSRDTFYSIPAIHRLLAHMDRLTSRPGPQGEAA